MALVGPSFTARAWNLQREPIELPLIGRHKPRVDLRAEFKAARELFAAGAESVEVIHWNNWRDHRGNVRFQSCALYSIQRRDGRLIRVRVNLFG